VETPALDAGCPLATVVGTFDCWPSVSCELTTAAPVHCSKNNNTEAANGYSFSLYFESNVAKQSPLLLTETDQEWRESSNCPPTAAIQL